MEATEAPSEEALKEQAERQARCLQKIDAVLKEEGCRLVTPAHLQGGPDGWFRPVGRLKVVALPKKE